MTKLVVTVTDEDPEAAAEVLRMIADKIDGGFTVGFDRREGGDYHFEIHPDEVLRSIDQERNGLFSNHYDGPHH